MATKKQPAKTPQTKKQGPTRGRASPPTHPAVTSFASQDPAKGIAVATTIGAQLIYERRWPPNDTNKVMGSDYRYNRETVSNFLRSVRWHLTYGNPQYFFDFDMPFADAALGQSVAELTGSVDAQTSDVVPAGWSWP